MDHPPTHESQKEATGQHAIEGLQEGRANRESGLIIFIGEPVQARGFVGLGPKHCGLQLIQCEGPLKVSPMVMVEGGQALQEGR